MLHIPTHAPVLIHKYTMVKPHIKGADRCIRTHTHLQTAGWYI